MLYKQLLLVTILCLLKQSIFACKCLHPSLEVEVQQSDLIFKGKVLSKVDSAYTTYYTFLVYKIWKGNTSQQIITIKTGIGGPDCGMYFEIEKEYIVFSNNLETNRCRRNDFADSSSDIALLNYRFDSTFRINVGLNVSSLLNEYEASYFNTLFIKRNLNINFKNKKVGFVLNKTTIDKKQYFNNWGGKEVANNLIFLNQEEKEIANGYDIIIVSWKKQGITKSFRKRLIQKLNKL